MGIRAQSVPMHIDEKVEPEEDKVLPRSISYQLYESPSIDPSRTLQSGQSLEPSLQTLIGKGSLIPGQAAESWRNKARIEKHSPFNTTKSGPFRPFNSGKSSDFLKNIMH